MQEGTVALGGETEDYARLLSRPLFSTKIQESMFHMDYAYMLLERERERERGRERGGEENHNGTKVSLHQNKICASKNTQFVLICIVLKYDT